MDFFLITLGRIPRPLGVGYMAWAFIPHVALEDVNHNGKKKHINIIVD
jgi:hypothetical protein